MVTELGVLKKMHFDMKYGAPFSNSGYVCYRMYVVA